MSIQLSQWDLGLVAVVTLQVTVIAFLHEAKWKAFVYGLPFPFSLAMLALGTQVNVTHAAGLFFAIIFLHGVRIMHYRFRFSIVSSIAAGAGLCLVTGLIGSRMLPDSEAAFWIVLLASAAVSIALLTLVRYPYEPGYRSPLPLYIKLPIVAVVSLGLVVMKGQLLGFMTMFPMVGISAAYEMRHSLWTNCRQGPINSLIMVPMLIICRYAAEAVGTIPALLLGWAAIIAVLIPLTMLVWNRASRSRPQPLN
jgi:hypothetical protein